MNRWRLIALSCSAILLGCGSDGNDGPIGVSIDDTPSLFTKFTEASVGDGQVSVTFKQENTNSFAVLGLTKDYALHFDVTQLANVVLNHKRKRI